MKFIEKLSHDAQGIFYIICSCLFASIMVAVVRHLSQDFHVLFIVMVRNFFALIFFVPQLIKNHKLVLQTNKFHLHAIRGTVGLASMIMWFYAISVIPLSQAVSISFIIPILTTLAAILILKEKVKSNSWLAIFIGFIGILIILRPGFREFNPAYFLIFGSVSLWAVSNIVIKMMIRTEKPKTIVAHMALIMLICSIPLAFPYMQPLDLKSLVWFVLLGLLSNLTHFSISLSYEKSDLSKVQPFDFTRLIFTSIIAYFAFGERFDFWVFVGSFVILFGVMIVLPRKKRVSKKKKMLAAQDV